MEHCRSCSSSRRRLWRGVEFHELVFRDLDAAFQPGLGGAAFLLRDELSQQQVFSADDGVQGQLDMPGDRGDLAFTFAARLLQQRVQRLFQQDDLHLIPVRQCGFVRDSPPP